MALMSSKYFSARKSHLNFYRATPLYSQNQSNEFMLYKPAGLKLSEMRIKQERYPETLYIKRIDKLRGIREVQKEFNQQLEKDIQSENVKNVKNTLISIVQETFSEPRSGSLEGVAETVNILVSEFTKESEVLKNLFRVSNKDYTTVLHSINVMALAIGYAHNENFSKAEKRILGLCALLHDVGGAEMLFRSGALQFSGDGRLVDAQGPGCFGLGAMIFKGLENKLPFDGGHGLGQRFICFHHIHRACILGLDLGSNGGGQVVHTDSRRVSQDYQAFADVHQFSYVARVVVG